MHKSHWWSRSLFLYHCATCKQKLEVKYVWCVYISCHLSIIIVMYSLILQMCSIWKVVSQTHTHTFILVVPHNMGHFEIINKSWMSLDYTIFSFRHMEWFITVLSLKVKQGYFFIILAYTTLEFNILKHWYLCYRKKKTNFDNIPLSLPNFVFHWFYLFLYFNTLWTALILNINKVFNLQN